MLAPVLVAEDPYAAASVFCQAGWKLEYETPRPDSAPRACVSLAQARVVLVTPRPRQQDALPRGQGVVLQLHASPHELSGLLLLHRATGLAVSEPTTRGSPPSCRSDSAQPGVDLTGQIESKLGRRVTP